MEIVKRRKNLISEIAEILDWNVCCQGRDYHKQINQMFIKSDWFKENYSKERVSEVNQKSSQLFKILNN